MISFTPVVDRPAVLRTWQSLEQGFDCSFFQSSHWIGAWLECLPSTVPLHLLSVATEGTVVALGLYAAGRERRHGVFSVKTLGLQATGREDFDCIAAEYGCLLSRADSQQPAWRDALEFFRSEHRDWDELLLEGARTELIDPWKAMNLPLRVLRRDQTFCTSLDKVRATKEKSCLSVLPSRTRTRIRSTRRGLESRAGQLTLEVARTTHEALAFLDELKNLHQRYWNSRDDPGAFSRPFFERFHRRLISTAFGNDVVQLIRIKAGETTVGYVYNFIYRGRVYFYQSGIDYDIAEKNESPGLLMHALLIDHYAALGHEIYDLLGGASQYKRALATDSYDLWWVALQQPRMKLTIERLAKGAYRTLSRMRQRPRPPT